MAPSAQRASDEADGKDSTLSLFIASTVHQSYAKIVLKHFGVTKKKKKKYLFKIQHLLQLFG